MGESCNEYLNIHGQSIGKYMVGDYMKNNIITDIEDIRFARLLNDVAEKINYTGESDIEQDKRAVSDLPNIIDEVRGALAMRDVDAILEATIVLEQFLGCKAQNNLCDSDSSLGLIAKYGAKINKLMEGGTSMDDYLSLYEEIIQEITPFNIQDYDSIMILLSRLDLEFAHINVTMPDKLKK